MILLSGPHDEDVPCQGNRVFLQESGHVIMAFPFKKEWSDLEVELKIREAFQVSGFRNFTIGSHQTVEAHVSSRTALDWSNDSSYIQGQAIYV